MSSREEFEDQIQPAAELVPPAETNGAFTAEPVREDPLRFEKPPLRRPPKPHPGFWWSVLWVLGYLLVLVACQVAGAVLALAIRWLRSPEPRGYLRTITDPNGTELGVILAPALLFQAIGGIFVAWLAIRLVAGRDWRREIALRLPSPTHVALVLLSLPALLILPGAVVREVHKYVKLDDQAQLHQVFSVWPVWLGVLLIGVGPGIGEELFCRGFLGRGLVGRYGAVVGVLITSMWFGVLHMDPGLMCGTALMGIWLHFTYLTSRSILVPMLLHFLNNSMAVLGDATTLLDDLPDFDHLDGNVGKLLRLGAVALMIGLGIALYLTRARLVRRVDDGMTVWQPPFPGVQLPPPNTGTVVRTPWPGPTAVAMALLGVGVFAFCVWQAILIHHAA